MSLLFLLSCDSYSGLFVGLSTAILLSRVRFCVVFFARDKTTGSRIKDVHPSSVSFPAFLCCHSSFPPPTLMLMVMMMGHTNDDYGRRVMAVDCSSPETSPETSPGQKSHPGGGGCITCFQEKASS